MKKNLFIFCLVIGLSARAQTSLNSGGGDATNPSAGSVAFSVGQMLYQSNSNTEGQVNAGIQQPVEWFVTSTESTLENELIRIYPNPSQDYLIISSSKSLEKSPYTLHNLEGKEVSRGKLEIFETNIPVAFLPAGAYILQIFHSNSIVLTSKILKK